jgi:hypothetical protein
MERRLLLLNSVLLRQNPHNVAEWHKRIKLYEGQPHEVKRYYEKFISEFITFIMDINIKVFLLLIFFSDN